MNTILQTNAAGSVRQILGGPAKPITSVRTGGLCPSCGKALISNCYYVMGRGYLILHECEASLSDSPTCQYRKVL